MVVGCNMYDLFPICMLIDYLPRKYNVILVFNLILFEYSHLFNKREGWNRRGGWDFFEKKTST